MYKYQDSKVSKFVSSSPSRFAPCPVYQDFSLGQHSNRSHFSTLQKELLVHRLVRWNLNAELTFKQLFIHLSTFLKFTLTTVLGTPKTWLKYHQATYLIPKQRPGFLATVQGSRL